LAKDTSVYGTRSRNIDATMITCVADTIKHKRVTEIQREK